MGHTQAQFPGLKYNNYKKVAEYNLALWLGMVRLGVNDRGSDRI